MAVIDQLVDGTATGVSAGGEPVGTVRVDAGRVAERAARADLRAQIAGLERRMADLAASTYPRLDLSPVTDVAAGAPRILPLGDLERTRDALAERLAAMRVEARAQAARQEDARETLHRMLADPPAHKGYRLTNRDLGIPGCSTYEVVPRFGILGRLASWWQVKISSGCP
jgi:hypothetical protein